MLYGMPALFYIIRKLILLKYLKTGHMMLVLTLFCVNLPIIPLALLQCGVTVHYLTQFINPSDETL